MKFSAIKRQASRFPVKWMCAWLGVSRAGFYAWDSRPQAALPGEFCELPRQIKSICAEHRCRYGSPRIHQELARRGIAVGKKRVEANMRSHGLLGRTRRIAVRTTISDDRAMYAPNILKRDFSTTGPNQKWVTDLTYVDTAEGFLYFAAIQDLFS